MPEVRVLERITRQMQRLGYFKRLVRRVVATSTSNAENLGSDLIETVSRRMRIPLSEERIEYIKLRLYDRVYSTLKKQAVEWINSNDKNEPLIVNMELQDLYLADHALPSGVGKLVKDDWDIYPAFGVSLGLIRAGTYSVTTRALALLHLISDEEQRAFLEYLSDTNPLNLSLAQSLLFLYSLIDNDGEVIAPFWSQLPQEIPFNDRETGDLLPEIYQSITTRHRKKILSADMRERLSTLEKSAESISRQRGKERYSGGSSREHASRPRLEPYVDIGLFSKPNRFRYEYLLSPTGKFWIQSLSSKMTTQDIGEFLSTRFFTTAAEAFGIIAKSISDPENIVPHLQRVSSIIASPGGYAPIEEMSLLAGIEGLLNHGIIIEHAIARDAIIAYQKANPYKVRFTVDRMGVLAHARFLEPSSQG